MKSYSYTIMFSSFPSAFGQLMVGVLLASQLSGTVHAYDLLPYSTRTRSYSAWSTTAKGDIRTVGMAGATVGLADTYIAALDNPAGLGMTLNGGDTNFATGAIYDGQIQNYNNEIRTYHFGAALSQYPWGFSLGYVVPTVEGQIYELSNPNKDPVGLSIITHEFHMSAARGFFHDKLSVGGSLIFGQSQSDMGFLNSPQLNKSFYSYSLGGSVGVSYQLPRRVLLGLSYSLPMRYSVDPPTNFSEQLPGYFQPIEVPSRIGLGVGWIPNRFLRADFSTFIIGPSSNTALLRDNSKLVGQNTTIQPKIGLAYYFIDYKELKATGFIGSYYEVSRIQDTPSRFHGTVGIELKTWVLSLGWALDTSRDYRNYIGSIGIDVFKVMEKLDIIPVMWRPPYAGAFPKPLIQSDEGLTRTLVKDWKPQGPKFDPIEIGLNIPSRIQDRAEKFGKDVMTVFKESFSATEPSQKKTSKPKEPNEKHKSIKDPSTTTHRKSSKQKSKQNQPRKKNLSGKQKV